MYMSQNKIKICDPEQRSTTLNISEATLFWNWKKAVTYDNKLPVHSHV